MSMDEIKCIKRQKQKPLYTCTFLSTSTDLELAKGFAGAGCRDLEASLQSVILDITGLDSEDPLEKNVADIHHLSLNTDESEILFSPAFLFIAGEVFYDENDKIWNISLDPITGHYPLSIEIDQLLIKFDVLIRLMLNETNLCQSNRNLNEHEKDFYSIFVDNVKLLSKELDDYESIHSTLNHINEKEKIKECVLPYELTGLRRFIECSANYQYKISPLLATTLYDCLANINKQNGKYNLAFEYFNKAIASTNDKENIRTTFIRKVSEFIYIINLSLNL